MDATEHCPNCEHPLALHSRPGGATGCHAGGCVCERMGTGELPTSQGAVDLDAATDRVAAVMIAKYAAASSEETLTQARVLARAALATALAGGR